jgi:hypothetical protein
MGIRGFERRLERLVEGAFARAFKSGLRPVELGRRIVREMDDNRSVGVRGGTVVPNAFTVWLSASDIEQFEGVHESLARELGDAAREHARDEGYSFLGPVEAEMVVEPSQRTGTFAIEARFREGPGGSGAGSLILPSGERYVLREHLVSLGRLPECDITLVDANVSRRHAEIRPMGDAFVLIDLGSTNGSKVNGMRVVQHELADGDELTFGSIRLFFEAS